MPSSKIIQNRIDNQTRLLYKFVYATSLLSIGFGLICILILNIHGKIPVIFFSFSFLNLLNLYIFKKHGKLAFSALIAATLSLLGTAMVTIFSGGIESPFIFILAIIVLGGYISARFFGRLYLVAVIIVVISIYAIDEQNFEFVTNEVPLESEANFSLVSLLFSVYIIGGVFGKDILNAHGSLKKSKTEIERRIDEKEMLLREIHHRVKNNLQTVSSLLNLQAKSSSNEKIKEMVSSSQNRVNSMAIIHEMLYTRDNISKIEFGSYVRELTEYLIRSAGGKEKNIVVNIDIPDIKLSIDTVISLGLLINETVTNSLKYGFVTNSGAIDIKLREQPAENTYTLDISDNGIGYSQEVDFKNTKSLGLKLIHNLARQLRGSAKRINSASGTIYTIVFKDIDENFTSMA